MRNSSAEELILSAADLQQHGPANMDHKHRDQSVQGLAANWSRIITVGENVITRNVYVSSVSLNWSDEREPYSPWVGVRTAAILSTLALLFVVYIIVRTRCTPARCHACFDSCLRCFIHDKPNSSRTCSTDDSSSSVLEKSESASDNRGAATRQGDEELKSIETSKRCLERVEFELLEIVHPRKLSSATPSLTGDVMKHSTMS